MDNPLTYIQEILQSHSSIATLLIEVDQLSQINHRAGVAVGDALLCAIEQRLSQFARDRFGAPSRVTRLDGPRFLMIPPPDTSLESLRAHERVLHTMLAKPIGADESPCGLRIVTSAFYRSQPIAESLRRAMEALAHPTAAQDGAHVKAALANDEIAIVYQPQYEQVAECSARLVGVEALIRWRHPQRGLLGAESLTTAAQIAGLECALTDHIHNIVLGEVTLWSQAMAQIRVALNITAADLADEDFPHRFEAKIARFAIDPTRLTLELTEQAMLSDPSAAAARLSAVRRMGCRIAVDDFGTGYSSLSLLASLPIDYLKIDGSFTHALDNQRGEGNSDREQLIVRAIADLAKALGLRVIAEGVERQAQLDILQTLGVSTWQGFLKSKAVPSTQLHTMLQAS